MDSFVAYAAHYSPGFPDRIEGADQAEITRLEGLAGYRLPDTYRRLLQRMGRNADRIRFEDCHLGLKFVLSFYEAMRVNPNLTLPADCLAIATYGVAAGEVCLDLASGPDPRVVIVTDEDETEYYAASLLARLYHEAFFDYRLTALPCLEYASSFAGVGGRDRRIEARALSERLGFRGQWFDEGINFHGGRGDAGLYWSQPPGHGLTLRVAAETRAETEEIGREFARTFGLEAYRRGK